MRSGTSTGAYSLLFPRTLLSSDAHSAVCASIYYITCSLQSIKLPKSSAKAQNAIKNLPYQQKQRRFEESLVALPVRCQLLWSGLIIHQAQIVEPVDLVI
jgi:hypothetical protein